MPLVDDNGFMEGTESTGRRLVVAMTGLVVIDGFVVITTDMLARQYGGCFFQFLSSIVLATLKVRMFSACLLKQFWGQGSIGAYRGWGSRLHWSLSVVKD
jgi:hypothetical protein